MLPPSSKDLLAELLLDLRLHIIPDEQLSANDNSGNSRYDIRGIAQLLSHLAVADSCCAERSSDATLEKGYLDIEWQQQHDIDLSLPPPPPPPYEPCLLAGAVLCQDLEGCRAQLHAPADELIPQFVSGVIAKDFPISSCAGPIQVDYASCIFSLDDSVAVRAPLVAANTCPDDRNSEQSEY